jgi:hypothetical protein
MPILQWCAAPAVECVRKAIFDTLDGTKLAVSAQVLAKASTSRVKLFTKS